MKPCFQLDDQQLLAECRVETYRASGPGGQKRNKTSSAVRISHPASGLSAVATESRSQHRNKAHALQRLRYQLALHFRQPVAENQAIVLPRAALHTTPKQQDYLLVMSRLLDVLHSAGWKVSDAACRLGASTGQLVGFLQADPKLKAYVNQQRDKVGLRKLVG